MSCLDGCEIAEKILGDRIELTDCDRVGCWYRIKGLILSRKIEELYEKGVRWFISDSTTEIHVYRGLRRKRGDFNEK